MQLTFTGCRHDCKTAKVCSTRVTRTAINVCGTRIMCTTSAQHMQTGRTDTLFSVHSFVAVGKQRVAVSIEKIARPEVADLFTDVVAGGLLAGTRRLDVYVSAAGATQPELMLSGFTAAP